MATSSEDHEFKAGSAFNRLKAVYKLLGSFLLALLFYFLLPAGHMTELTHLLLAWDIFSMCMIIVSWVTFLTTRPDQMLHLARIQDESRGSIFIIVLVSTFAGLLAVLLLLAKDEGRVNNEVRLMVSILGMAFSWLLVHTVFTLRYADLYYSDSFEKPGVSNRGISFPGEEEPDYVDFAYFSFVLGMTFQVSDASILLRKIRRLALLHGIISFVFNTIIVALTINVIAGLGK